MAGRYGLQIRTANPGDAPGLAELMDRGGCSLGASAWAERLEAVGREAGIVLLALEGGPPSGVIALNWVRLLAHDQPVAQIGTLLVDPAERRRGIARLLLKAGSQAARAAGCGRLHLLASAADGPLAAFARSSGFAEGGPGFDRPLRKAARHP